MFGIKRLTGSLLSGMITPMTVRMASALVALGLLTACSSSHASSPGGAATPPQSAPSVIVMAGSVSVTDPDGGAKVGADGTITIEQRGGPCTLSGGFSDIAEGAEVVVSDDAGATLTITTLQAGVFGANNMCTFPFSAKVVAGKKFYGIAVSHRGTVKLPEAEMAEPKLTIGT